MSPRRRHVLVMSLLVAGLLGVYLVGNGRVPLFDRDEPRYAVTSRAMLATGDWVVPRFLGEVRTAKPPAIYWLQAAAMRGLGTGEFAVRLPGALACAAAVALVAFELPALVGRRRAAWAAFMLGTSVLVLGVAKVGVIDGVLLLCVTAMQIALLRIIRHRGSDLANAAVLWMAVALGGLLKGPVILGVLAMTLLAWWAGRWIKPAKTPGGAAPRLNRGLVARLHPFLGLLIVAVICGPWLVMISIREPSFIRTALGHDVATRSISGLEGHGQPPGFHLLALFGTWFPWSVLLPITLVHAWRRRGNDTIRFALAACVGPWVMFEIVITKLPHYLLVIFPMLSLLTADWLVASLFAVRRGRFPPAMPVAGVIYALVAVGFAVAPALLGAASLLGSIAAALWAGVMLAAWLRRRLAMAILAGGIGMAGVVAIGYADWIGRVPMLTVSKRTASALALAGAREAAMVHYKEPSLAWYSGELGIRVHESDENGLERESGFAVSTQRKLEAQPAEVRAKWMVRAAVPARLYNDALRSEDVVILSAERPSATD